jgi:hypothetical protein
MGVRVDCHLRNLGNAKLTLLGSDCESKEVHDGIPLEQDRFRLNHFASVRNVPAEA